MAELTVEQLEYALESGDPYFLVRVKTTTGSTPRDAGALMLVGESNISGTIGGGSAEWVAVQRVREFIKGAAFNNRETITLGPEIDQCCGGTIEVVYAPLTKDNLNSAVDQISGDASQQVMIFGAGHTGMALANALGVLGMRVTIVDTRPEYRLKFPDHDVLCLALPEKVVREAREDTVFIVTTHDHSLDFLITSEVLARKDAAYVGMIGSKTKRAVLKSWMGDNGYDATSVEQLFCPIGGSDVRNKQPEVIAAMCVAEILRTIEPQG